MNSYPSLRRVITALLTVTVLGLVMLAMFLSHKRGDGDRARANASKEEVKRNWPLFGGSLSRNFVNTWDQNIPTEWNVEEGSEKNVKWAADLGSLSYGGPTIAGGKVFVGTNNQKPRDPKITGDKGIIMCFRESDGKFLWQHVHDKLASGQVNDWQFEGICSTPMVDGNRLYYVSNRCEVVCSDTDGNIQWKLDMIKKLDVFPHNLSTCSPLIVGDLLFIITSNGVDEGHINIPQPKAPSFLTLDKKTGEILWQSNLPSVKLVQAEQQGKNVSIENMKDRGEILMHGQWSNPVYAEVSGRPQVIFPGGNGWLYSFEPKSGKLIWKFDANPKSSVYILGPKGTRNDFIATPVIYDHKVYIGVGQDPEHKDAVGHLWCVDITKEGDVSPELVVDDSVFPPKTKPNPNSAAVWHFGGVDPDGKERGYHFGRTLCTCAVHDGLVYVADMTGYFFCFDAKTGQKYWDENMNAQTWASPYWVDGKVYMATHDGTIYIFKHGKQKNLLGQVEMGGSIGATPVVANGVLYVMTENKLFAIENKGK